MSSNRSLSLSLSLSFCLCLSNPCTSKYQILITISLTLANKTHKWSRSSTIGIKLFVIDTRKIDIQHFRFIAWDAILHDARFEETTRRENSKNGAKRFLETRSSSNIGNERDRISINPSRRRFPLISSDILDAGWQDTRNTRNTITSLIDKHGVGSTRRERVRWYGNS